MKKIFLLILFFLLVHLILLAQSNLVTNPGFEERTWCCPDLSWDLKHELNCVKDWKLPERGGAFTGCGRSGTSDYFNVCGDDWSPLGPRTGDGYAGIFVGPTDGYREYITVELTNPLEIGKSYYVEFYVLSRFGGEVDKIGTYFSINRPRQCGGDVFNAAPHIVNPSGKLIEKEDGWTKISGNFFPLYEYEWITIGSFALESDLITNGVCPGNGCYYFIDDVLVREGCEADCCPEFEIYENTSNLPAYTIRDDYIKVGENVKVLSGQNVYFQAGNYIDLDPSFETEPGAIFETVLAPCEEAPIEVPLKVSILSKAHSTLKCNSKLIKKIFRNFFY